MNTNEGKTKATEKTEDSVPAAEAQGANGTVEVTRKLMLDLVHALNRAGEKLKATGGVAPLVTQSAEYTAQMDQPLPKLVKGMPRRNNKECWTLTERAIHHAMERTERIGAHPLLTEAVTLLGQAADRVADYLEATAEELSAQAARATTEAKAPEFTCFRCQDGQTPLYCLNCAEVLLMADKRQRLLPGVGDKDTDTHGLARTDTPGATTRFLDLGNGERISMDQVVEYRVDECAPPCVTLIMANKDWKSTCAPRGIDRKAAAQWLDELFGARPLWK